MLPELKITKNALSQDLRSLLHVLTRDGRQPSGVNFFHFTEDVVGVSNSIFQFSIEGELKDKLEKELLDTGLLPNKPKKWHAHVNLFTRGAFIPWHNDADFVYNVTIYLNEKWDHNWGGAFLYGNDSAENIACIYPQHNLGVAYKTPMWHTTTLTAINAPMRESVQIFVVEY